jgi:hypothetical protein
MKSSQSRMEERLWRRCRHAFHGAERSAERGWIVRTAVGALYTNSRESDVVGFTGPGVKHHEWQSSEHHCRPLPPANDGWQRTPIMIKVTAARPTLFIWNFQCSLPRSPATCKDEQKCPTT